MTSLLTETTSGVFDWISCCPSFSDPAYLNSAEQADVKLLVEGQYVFAHRAVLMHTSSRFSKMLTSLADDNLQTPVVQLNDIRYKTLQVRDNVSSCIKYVLIKKNVAFLVTFGYSTDRHSPVRIWH